jgi:hypothetical protein
MPVVGVTYRGTDKLLNKLQRQKILIFIYPIYNNNWKNISNIQGVSRL